VLCTGARACNCDAHSSCWCAGILNIGLAVVAAYGFAGYVGLLFTPLMSILPFIMLGVGVDGMFVLQAALDATDPEVSMEDRMAEAMRSGGVSVAVASLTNFGAFMIGSNTSLPALSAFSIYAALGLLFNLILQVRPPCAAEAVCSLVWLRMPCAAPPVSCSASSRLRHVLPPASYVKLCSPPE
jgi:uncharacterized membrane protein YdfJ with MMPL/SSD domain